MRSLLLAVNNKGDEAIRSEAEQRSEEPCLSAWTDCPPIPMMLEKGKELSEQTLSQRTLNK